jgi:hypothetical protein
MVLRQKIDLMTEEQSKGHVWEIDESTLGCMGQPEGRDIWRENSAIIGSPVMCA